MADTSLVGAARGRWSLGLAARLLQAGVLIALAALVLINLGFFALHAAQVLRYPYPLDYGEGPLLAQVNLLRQGTSLAQLYGPLDAPPYLVVNYPPVYLLTSLAASLITGDALLAGRLVSLLATLACCWALFVLSAGETAHGRRNMFGLPALAVRLTVALSFLALPIVREWAALMRVDMLGVAFGLWALVVVRRATETRHVLWAVPLLLLGMFTKPLLVAAPAAAVAYILARDWRRGMLFGAVFALSGAAVFAALAVGSHFFEHVVVANANTWQRALAERFWRGEFAIHGPLFLAAILALIVQAWIHSQRTPRLPNGPLTDLVLPVVYTLVGGLAAAGVGKVGAYLNYFLELYAGLIWLVALAVVAAQPSVNMSRSRVLPFVNWLSALVLPVLLGASLVRYYPTWSENYVKLAGIIEGENPPRAIVGKRGVWQDLRRERQILATLARVNRALVADVQAAGAPILTDVPGIAAQAGQVSRLQSFEHSQIAQLWDQRSLRLDLANGHVPLVVLDYLGNWLTPEVIELIRHRYAQDGSRGTYDIYRPVALGTWTSTNMPVGENLQVAGYYLDRAPASPGALVPLTLVWAPLKPAPSPDMKPVEVVLTLRGSNGDTVLEDVRPLVYGALRPSEIPAEGVQHMQPLRLPATLPEGEYALEVALRSGVEQTTPVQLGGLHVEQHGGLLAHGWLAEDEQEFVPDAIMWTWQTLGGTERLGLPLAPAVPFAEFTQQCFERGCLRLRGTAVEQAPVGEWVSVGDIGANGFFMQPAISAGFQAFYQAHGGAAALGEAITNEFRSGERIVQYTRFARLERPLNGGEPSFGNIGEDYLRLPGGEAYRWP